MARGFSSTFKWPVLMLCLLGLCSGETYFAGSAWASGSALGGQVPAGPPATAALTTREAEMVRLVNGYRAVHGLSALSVSPQLSRAARKHAEAMAGRGEMAHILEGEGPGARARAEGFMRTVGENVASGTPGETREFLDLWVGSAEHRANMLRVEWGEIGVGFAHSEGQGEDYWVGMFGAAR